MSFTGGTNIISRPQISALLLSAGSIAVTEKISSIRRLLAENQQLRAHIEDLKQMPAIALDLVSEF